MPCSASGSPDVWGSRRQQAGLFLELGMMPSRSHVSSHFARPFEVPGWQGLPHAALLQSVTSASLSSRIYAWGAGLCVCSLPDRRAPCVCLCVYPLPDSKVPHVWGWLSVLHRAPDPITATQTVVPFASTERELTIWVILVTSWKG